MTFVRSVLTAITLMFTLGCAAAAPDLTPPADDDLGDGRGDHSGAATKVYCANEPAPMRQFIDKDLPGAFIRGHKLVCLEREARGLTTITVSERSEVIFVTPVTDRYEPLRLMTSRLAPEESDSEARRFWVLEPGTHSFIVDDPCTVVGCTDDADPETPRSSGTLYARVITVKTLETLRAGYEAVNERLGGFYNEEIFAELDVAGTIAFEDPTDEKEHSLLDSTRVLEQSGSTWFPIATQDDTEIVPTPESFVKERTVTRRKTFTAVPGRRYAVNFTAQLFALRVLQVTSE